MHDHNLKLIKYTGISDESESWLTKIKRELWSDEQKKRTKHHYHLWKYSLIKFVQKKKNQ